MSNYLSSEYKVTNPPQFGDLRILDNVMTTLQGSYDKNKTLIDQTLNLYSQNLKGLTEDDNKYLASKISEVKNQISLYSKKNPNLAYSYNKDSIMTTISSVLQDPVVQNILESRQNYMNYNASVSKLAEKDPKAMNDANYRYSLHKAGYEDYMQGKTKKLGQVQYIPYTDLTEEHLKKLKTITDVKGKRFIETLSPDGKYKVRKEIDGLTQDEIQNYMGSLMTSQELMQMQINGWAKYGQNEPQARAVYGDYNNQRLAANTDNINLYEARANNTNLSAEQRKEAKQQVEVLKDKEKGIKANIANISSMPIDNIGLELERANYLNGLGQIASTEWSQTLDTNDVYYKDKELEIKYEELDIKKQELALKNLEFQKKNGVNAAGKPVADGVVTVSPAEVNTEDMGDQIGQENLQSRHNTYYDTILNTAKGLLTNPDVEESDKKAFEAELKSRGLDTNLKWTNPQNANKHSIASTVKAAFDAAKLGASYKQESEIISDAVAKKQNIAKDIVSVEGEAYSKVFNQDPDKYVDFLNVASSQVGIMAQSESIWTDTENTSAIKLKSDIDNFAKSAGGWKNMKTFLSKNPNKLREFAELTKRADEEYKGVASYQYDDKNLIEDAKVETEKLLQDKSKRGAISSFTDYNTINFINETVNSEIINSIPQDRITGEVFDPKVSITAKLVGEDIVIEQYRGGTTSKGVFSSGTKNSKAVLNKGDASYEIMMRYITAKEEEQFGLNADTTSVKLPPSKPSVIRATKEGVKAANVAYNIMQSVQSNPSIANLFAAVGGNPTAYTSDKEISKTFEVKLANYPQEQVDAFTQNYLNRLSGFSITPFVSKLYGEKKWAISIKNDQNEEILNTSLGIKVLDKDTQWMLENAPQTFITEHILRELISDTKQTKINTILDGGN